MLGQEALQGILHKMLINLYWKGKNSKAEEKNSLSPHKERESIIRVAFVRSIDVQCGRVYRRVVVHRI